MSIGQEGTINSISEDRIYPIKNFLFFFPSEKYHDSCLCELFTLRNAIFIFSFIKIIFGLFSVLEFLHEIEIRQYEEYSDPGCNASLCINMVIAITIIPSIYGIVGAAKTHPKKVAPSSNFSNN